MVLAALAVAALILAVRTGSTWAAVLVVALAAAGILALLRDWRSERGAATPPAGEDAGAQPATPDEFSPDISTHPGGPSSDARADQL